LIVGFIFPFSLIKAYFIFDDFPCPLQLIVKQLKTITDSTKASRKKDFIILSFDGANSQHKRQLKN